jgi:DNA-binding protein
LSVCGVFKNEVAYYITNVNSEEVKVMSSEPNVIFVGMKPPMSYVLAIITFFSGTDAKVTLKARGQAINTAVDAAEIARHRFMKELSVSKITIGTEEMPPREGENRNRNVSTIEITLTRQ